jgi:hypothetical protein
LNDEVETRQLASFQQAVALGYGDQPQRAIQELETLLQEVHDKEDKGWIILYQAFSLARVERMAEARALFRKLANLWEDTRECRARIAAADATLDEASGHAALALKKLNRILKHYRMVWSSQT